MNVRLGNFMSWGYIEAEETFTYALWQEFSKRQESLDEVFAYAATGFDVKSGGETRAITGAFVSAQAFQTLGLRAGMGRTFDEGEERDAAGAPVVLISHRLWERAFSMDPAVLGRPLHVDGKPFTVIGVAPREFFGLVVGQTADIYLPLAAEPYLRGKDAVRTFACFTAANLMLARATSRHKEIAVRVVGVLWRSPPPPSDFPRARFVLEQASTEQANLLDVNWRSWIRVFGGLRIFLAPALGSNRPTLSKRERDHPIAVMRLRRLLLGGQIAATVVLITGAVLFGTTLSNLLTVETGFDRENVLVGQIDLRRSGLSVEARKAFYRDLLARVEQLPLVESASLSYVTPISGWAWQFDVQAQSPDGPRRVHIHYNAVSPDFFTDLPDAAASGTRRTP